MNMNQKIQILKITEGDTDSRYPTPPSTDIIRDCFAKVEAKGLRDYQTALANQTLNELSFTIRQSKTEINTTMKVRFQGEDLNIKKIFPDHVNKKYMEIIAEAVS